MKISVLAVATVVFGASLPAFANPHVDTAACLEVKGFDLKHLPGCSEAVQAHEAERAADKCKVDKSRAEKLIHDCDWTPPH